MFVCPSWKDIKVSENSSHLLLLYIDWRRNQEPLEDKIKFNSESKF